MIEVIKAGVADSVQDAGRFGFQHLGINPNGAMDLNAMKIANALVGNVLNEAVIEMGFPAAIFHFRRPALIALSGADHTPKINGQRVAVHQPMLVPAGSELKFTRALHGAWSYLAVQGGFDIPLWLNSYSTNSKAHKGGFHGRSLKKGDVIAFRKTVTESAEPRVFSWRTNVQEFYKQGDKKKTIRCTKGNEHDWLTKKSQADFLKQQFSVSTHSDRMGYRLSGPLLRQPKKQKFLSSGVSFGTIQLLPNGELVILMADHQTSGGYPRVAHVIAADRTRLVQSRPDEGLQFSFIDQYYAEELFLKQEQTLRQLQQSCKFRLRELTI
jgi:antagonist of KipI